MLATGTVVAGYRTERLIRRDSGSALYEATQLSLGRRVALRLIAVDERTDAADVALGIRRHAELRHPHVVAIFDTGRCEQGLFVAMRWVGDQTLADLRGQLPRDRRRLLGMLGQVAQALEAAHAAGLVHGSLCAQDVLVDASGDAYLAWFSAVGVESSARVDADRRAFALLLAECLGERPVPGERPALPTALVAAAADEHGAARWRRRLLGLVAVAGCAAVAAAVALTDGGEPAAVAPLPAPALTVGTTAVGAALSPGPVRIVDCEGERRTANSPPCSIAATTSRVAAAGVVRRWAVRGAQGVLALQILRRGTGGTFAEVRRSQYQQVDGAGPRAFTTDLPVRAGDVIGLEVATGGALGVRPGRGALLRWRGPLELIRAPRRPSLGPRPLTGALQLRADVAVGAGRAQPSGRLTGERARRAPAGRTLEAEEVELDGGVVVRVLVVALPGVVVVDLVRGGRRVVRLPVAGADPRGRLRDLGQGFTDGEVLRLIWRNPGRALDLIHDYATTSGTLRVVS